MISSATAKSPTIENREANHLEERSFRTETTLETRILGTEKSTGTGGVKLQDH